MRTTQGESGQLSSRDPPASLHPDSRFTEPDRAINSAVGMSVSLPRVRIALVALAVTAVAIVLAAAPYKAFDLDRYFVPKELVLHAGAAIAALAVVTGARRLTLTTVDWLIAAFLAASAISAAFAINLWTAERALAISVSGALAFWAAGVVRRAGGAPLLLIALAASVVIAAATSLAQAYGVESDLFSLNRAPGGTFGNRNFIAHYVAIGTPVVALTALTARRGLGSVFGGVGIAVLSASLVMSRSRGAWLAVLVLAVLTGLAGFGTRDRWRQPTTVRRLLVMAGAAVVLVSGPVNLPDPPGVAVVKVETAQQMFEAVDAALPADAAIFAAAVADWRSESESESKIKKQPGRTPTLKLTENPDILSSVAHRTSGRPRLVVGFAAETDDVVANAQAKRMKKGCDWIVANDVSAESGVMGGDTNTVHLVTASGVESWPPQSKQDVARALVLRIAETLAGTRR